MSQESQTNIQFAKRLGGKPLAHEGRRLRYQRLTVMVSALVATSMTLLLAIPSTGATAATTSLAKNATLAKEVPAKYHGTITVANSAFPPYDFVSSSNAFSGIDPDLFKYMGELLGVDFKFELVNFNTVIPGIENGRYDTSSPLGDFKDREGAVHFVDYAVGVSSVLVASNSSFRPKTVAGLCDNGIGYESGAAESQVISEIDKICKSKGKADISEHSFPNEPAEYAALSSGRIQGVLADAASNGYTAVHANGDFVNLKVTGGASLAGWGATFGIVVSKNSGTLGEAMVGAIKILESDGLYNKVFTKWGAQDEELTQAKVMIDGGTPGS